LIGGSIIYPAGGEFTDIRKTLGELDIFFEKNRYDEVESFLLSKIKEAERENDSSALLTLLNELIGFYRSSSRCEEAVSLGDDILSLMMEMGLEQTVPYATSILNVATAYREAGKIDESIQYYDVALKIYKNTLPEYDMKLASLYNNMSQAWIEKKYYEKACNFLGKSLLIIAQNGGTETEEAVADANLAMTLMKMNQLADALKYIEKSLRIFEKTKGRKDFHYSAALSAMGDIQFKLRNYEAALEFFNKALDEMENNIGKKAHYAMICANISLIYDKMNDKEQNEKYKAMAKEIYHKLKIGRKLNERS